MASRNRKETFSAERTHHDTAVEAVRSDSDNDVFAVTIQDLGARNHETIGISISGVESVNVGTLASGPLTERDAIFVSGLFDGVRLSSCIGFIAFDIVAGNENTITGDNLTRLEEDDVTDKQFLDVDDALGTGADHLDATSLLLAFEDQELPFLLPIIDGTDRDLWKWEYGRE